MSAWASSKFVPGQFTGSTGANILTAKELQSGFQAWAKRVSKFIWFSRILNFIKTIAMYECVCIFTSVAKFKFM